MPMKILEQMRRSWRFSRICIPHQRRPRVECDSSVWNLLCLAVVKTLIWKHRHIWVLPDCQRVFEHFDTNPPVLPILRPLEYSSGILPVLILNFACASLLWVSSINSCAFLPFSKRKRKWLQVFRMLHISFLVRSHIKHVLDRCRVSYGTKQIWWSPLQRFNH